MSGYGKGFTGEDNDYWDYYHPNNGNVMDFNTYKHNIKMNNFKRGITKLRDRLTYTPDIIKLKEDAQLFPVFVYGEEQTGKIFSGRTNGCEFYGKAKTCTNTFVLQHAYQEVTSYICFESGRDLIDSLGIYNSAGKSVRGELYGAPLNKLCEFDHFYRNGRKFERKQFMVELNDVYTNKNHYVRAFMYIGKPKEFEGIKMASSSVAYSGNTTGDYIAR